MFWGYDLYTFEDGYTPSRNAWDKFKRDFKRKYGDDFILEDDKRGNLRIYALVGRFSSREFKELYETKSKKRVMLGNMCEIDIIEKDSD